MQLELTRAQKVYLAYLARAREEIANDLRLPAEQEPDKNTGCFDPPPADLLVIRECF